MAKLTWERLDTDVITIRKAKGKITVEEMIDFMHEPAQINMFDGKLAVFLFRVNGDADRHLFMVEEQPGDAVDLIIVEDEGRCPICNQQMFVQYCPDCGRKLFGESR